MAAFNVNDVVIDKRTHTKQCFTYSAAVDSHQKLPDFRFTFTFLELAEIVEVRREKQDNPPNFWKTGRRTEI